MNVISSVSWLEFPQVIHTYHPTQFGSHLECPSPIWYPLECSPTHSIPIRLTPHLTLPIVTSQNNPLKGPSRPSHCSFHHSLPESTILCASKNSHPTSDPHPAWDSSPCCQPHWLALRLLCWCGPTSGIICIEFLSFINYYNSIHLNLSTP